MNPHIPAFYGVEPGELPSRPSRFAPLFKALRRFFCKHAWALFSDHRYHVTDKAGRIVGEVSLAVYTCEHCGCEKVIPHNRTP